MQSRAKGIVAIEPKYVPASNNADHIFISVCAVTCPLAASLRPSSIR